MVKLSKHLRAPDRPSWVLGVGVGEAQKTQALSPGSWSFGSRMQVLHRKVSVMRDAASLATKELCDCLSLSLQVVICRALPWTLCSVEVTVLS